jgi:transcriptional regulator with XRE-family HTH domain
MEDISKALSLKRESLKLSYTQVSEMTGITVSTIKMIEEGKKPPTEAEIRRLGSALGIDEAEVNALIANFSRPKLREAVKAIGSRITAARNMRGYTQLKLSQLSSITPAALSQIEAGLRAPSSPALKNIAEALKVSSDYLLGNTKDQQGGKPKIDDLMLQRAFRSADRLTEPDKQKIADFIEFLSSKSQKNTQE